MGKKTLVLLLFILLISTVKCTQKIYDTPEEQVSTGPINVAFNVSGAMTAGSKLIFSPVISGGTGDSYRLDWDWNGDGYIDSSSVYPRVETVEYEYWQVGSYNVILKVTDKVGNTATYSEAVNIIEGMKPLEIVVVYNQLSPLMTNTKIVFTSVVQYGAGDYRLKWTFDGGVSIPSSGYNEAGNMTTEYTFASGGTHNVTLEVKDKAGNIVSKTFPFDIESHTKYSIVYELDNDLTNPEDSEIWKMYQNGENPLKLTDGRHPHINYNGTDIVYTKLVEISGAKIYRLYKINKNGGTPVEIDCSTHESPPSSGDRLIRHFYEHSHPKWSPDNSKIIYTRRTKTVTITTDRIDENVFIQLLDNNFTTPPLVIKGYDAYGMPIYDTYNVDGVWLRDYAFQLKLKDPDNPYSPKEYVLKDTLTNEEISKVIRLLWYTQYISKTYSSTSGLYIINANGTGETLITTDASDVTWHPDGNKIAYVKNNNIYEHTPVVGGSATLFLESSYGPAYSPDRNYFVYTLAQDGDCAMYYSQVNALGIRILINNGYKKIDNVSFKPDSKSIIYAVYGESQNGYGQFFLNVSSIPTGKFAYIINKEKSIFKPNFIFNF